MRTFTRINRSLLQQNFVNIRRAVDPKATIVLRPVRCHRAPSMFASLEQGDILQFGFGSDFVYCELGLLGQTRRYVLAGP